MKIVGVAEPDDVRRRQAAEIFNLTPNQCFQTAEELAEKPQIADLAINGTMDREHVPTTLPLLSAGYHVLLEKPISPSEQEMFELLDAVRETQRVVCVCHVLRHAPFYAEIRRRLADGEIGKIMTLHTAENVSYHHMAVGFIRGKWNREEVNPMLLAKCCHDMDLLCWLKSGVAPQRVASFGSLMHFKEENAPAGAGKRCLVDCRIENTCPYSARKNYIEQELWGMYVWHGIEHIADPTLEQKLESLQTDNPHGRCVWRCDNDVVDHQSVLVEFADGAVATHDMIGGVSRPCRTIHLLGTEGEIEGNMEAGTLVIRKPDPRKGHEYSEQQIELNVSADMHGGGDHRLVKDFLRLIRGEEPSQSTTSLMDSIHGHQIAYAADDAMRSRQVVEIHTPA